MLSSNRSWREGLLNVIVNDFIYEINQSNFSSIINIVYCALSQRNKLTHADRINRNKSRGIFILRLKRTSLRSLIPSIKKKSKNLAYEQKIWFKIRFLCSTLRWNHFKFPSYRLSSSPREIRLVRFHLFQLSMVKQRNLSGIS